MNFFLFIILAGYAVRCDDSNYYVVQMPEKYIPPKDFKVYWNVPTTQCKSKKIYFQDLYEKFGIIQNEGDTFRGDKISILYDPGDFPALLKNSSSGEIKYRNGGVPQEGDLIRHLNTFQKVLEQSIPDQGFNGVGIIDFESWRPVLRQNFGTLTPYKDVSYEIEKKRHWWWKKQWLLEEAKRRFEEAAREFMQATVALAKKMRPDAVWGYYGFPYCFNMAADKKEKCADGVPEENDRPYWLWQESTALYPSVYSSYELSTNQLVGLIRGRVKEAARVVKGGAPILPYFWFRYRDKGYFSESDLDAAFNTMYKSNASGFIIWGSSNDVNTIDKCKNLIEYVTNVLGPAVAKYTKPNMRVDDDNNEIYSTVPKPHDSNATTIDPEYVWIPPVNYTQRVKEMVDKELKEEKEAALKPKENNESILVDMILHKIANYCAEGCGSSSKVTTESGDGSSSTTTGYNTNTNEYQVDLVTEDPFKVSSTIGVTSMSVPTTTEEDDYTYDYESNEYFDIKTTSEEISTIAKADEIIVIDVINEQSTEASSVITEADKDYFIIEQDNSIDLDTEENSLTESSITTISITEPSVNKNATSFSTTASSITDESTIDNLNVEDNTTTVKPSTVNDYTTVGPSEFDSYSTDNSATSKLSAVDDSTTEISDSSTTMVPVTEQVLVSVSRAIVSSPVACSLFYIYSISKCICLLLGTC